MMYDVENISTRHEKLLTRGTRNRGLTNQGKCGIMYITFRHLTCMIPCPLRNLFRLLGGFEEGVGCKKGRDTTPTPHAPPLPLLTPFVAQPPSPTRPRTHASKMLLTLELIVFAFTVIVAVVTAILRLIDRLNTLHSILVRLETEVNHIKEQQASQQSDLHELYQYLHETNPARPSFRSPSA
jgi:hypothetical protein